MSSQQEAVSKKLFEKLDKVGDCRRYLWKLFLICILPSIPNGFHFFNYLYSIDAPEHWCNIPELASTNWTLDQKRSISSPSGSNMSSCEFYPYNYTILARMTFQKAENMVKIWKPNPIKCEEYSYGTGVETLVTEYDLVCNKLSLRSAYQAALNIGKFMGILIFGLLSDMYGRKIGFVAGSFLAIISGFVITISPSYGLVIAGRLLLGCGESGIFYCALIILMETASSRRRNTLGILANLSYPVGMMILHGSAYLIRGWRYLQYAAILPSLLILISCWLIPESPRWQIVNGQVKKAAKFLEKKCKSYGLETNENEMTPAIVINDVDEDQEQTQRLKGKIWKSVVDTCSLLGDQVRTEEMRHRTIFLMTLWGINTFSYYGLALENEQVDFNRYIFGFMIALWEVPGYLLPLLFLKFLRRRHLACILFSLAAIAIFTAIPLTRNSELAVVFVIVVFFGRLALVGVFAVILLQTFELYPTTLRNTGFGMSVTAGRIAAMSTQAFITLTAEVWTFLPIVIFGCLLLLASFLELLLPEPTVPLPNTAEDISEVNEENQVGLHQVLQSWKHQD